MLHPDLPEFWIPISDHRENLRARQSVLEYDVYNIGRATSKKKKQISYMRCHAKAGGVIVKDEVLQPNYVIYSYFRFSE